MKKGTIVYLTDAASITNEINDQQIATTLGLDPRWTVLAASMCGFYEMEDATRILIQRGANTIEAVMASMDELGGVKMGDEKIRVFG